MRDRGIFLVAHLQGAIRGGLIAVPRSSSEAHITAFAVQRHYLGRGIGKALEEAAVPQLRDLGYSTVSTVAPRDPDGSSFFKHRKWVHIGTQRTAEFGEPQFLDTWQLKL